MRQAGSRKIHKRARDTNIPFLQLLYIRTVDYTPKHHSSIGVGNIENQYPSIVPIWEFPKIGDPNIVP